MYEQFTDRARKVMELANQEALRFQHEYIGTEHILLGLISEGTGVAATVLQLLGVDVQKARSEVERIIQRGPYPVTGQLPATPRAKKVVEYAYDEARELKHEHVGTEHLLLGLLGEIEGVAAQVLMNLGLSLPRVRQSVLAVLGYNIPTAGVETAATKVPVELNPDLQRLPEPARNIVLEFDRQIDILEQEKGKAVANQEWEKAVNLRELQQRLHKLKFEFTRHWLQQ